MKNKLLVANASAFYGDRLSAVAEMVRGGPIDVLTGDYLAELTMAILLRQRLKRPEMGYASTFLAQMEEVLGECLDRSIRVVTNAGGLNPRGLARALEALAARLGLRPRIAFLEGDDLAPRLDALRAAGETFAHLGRGTPLAESGRGVLTANAYLGGWGIKEALDRGADIVVCPRVADASLVVGPAAWAFELRPDDWDRLAAAAAAGHILECGTQATGGNYSFLEEVPSFARIGFPIAELSADGSFVVTKHPGTGGLVSVGTVTAQLLYEIRDPHYVTPDVVARFDTLRLHQEGPDRVRVEGARGEPAPPMLKVSMNLQGGHKNSMTVLLCGPDIEEKARLVEEALFAELGGRERFEQVHVELVRSDHPQARTNAEALAQLRITVMDRDPDKVGRSFSAAVIEMALASIPGFTCTTPPGDATPYVLYWPALVSRSAVEERLFMGDEEIAIAAPPPAYTSALDPWPEIQAPAPAGPRVQAMFGRAFGARSGDKGGDANLGVWARSSEGYTFLREFLAVERLVELLPDLAPFPIERYELPNLFALNFYVRGLLGDGVSSSTRVDPQAKTLGEYLRGKVVELPVALLAGAQPAEPGSEA